MRKLLMLAAMALAALAVSAPSALATNFDFPHFPYEGDDWTAVHVDDVVNGGECAGPCAFDTGSDNVWRWSAPWGGQTIVGNCTGGMEGEVSATGDVEVTDVTHVYGGQYPSFGDGLCTNYEPVDLEQWTGLACYHVPSGEVWLRQSIAIDHNNGNQRMSGETFGKIVSGLDGESDVLEFRVAASPYFTDLGLRNASGAHVSWEHDAQFPFTGMAFTAAEGPCGWSELS